MDFRLTQTVAETAVSRPSTLSAPKWRKSPFPIGVDIKTVSNTVLCYAMGLRAVAFLISIAFSICAQEPLRFERKIIQTRTTGCIATFEYPEIITAGSPQARDRINSGILDLLLRQTGWPSHASGFRSLRAYIDDFMKSCAAHPTRYKQAYVHKRVTIFRYTPPVLSFRCVASEDAGGVHPFGTTFFTNFDSSTGKAITMNDLVKEGSFPKLESLAEAHFRGERNLSATDSLSERSYNFPDDRFKLNDNFGIGEEQLVFFFNTYEIGPGAMGSSEIKLRYQNVQSLLKIDLSQ